MPGIATPPGTVTLTLVWLQFKGWLPRLEIRRVFPRGYALLLSCKPRSNFLIRTQNNPKSSLGGAAEVLVTIVNRLVEKPTLLADPSTVTSLTVWPKTLQTTPEKSAVHLPSLTIWSPFSHAIPLQ